MLFLLILLDDYFHFTWEQKKGTVSVDSSQSRGWWLMPEIGLLSSALPSRDSSCIEILHAVKVCDEKPPMAAYLLYIVLAESN